MDASHVQAFVVHYLAMATQSFDPRPLTTESWVTHPEDIRHALCGPFRELEDIP
ncbi:hypothetical protein FA13DRAFT_1736449 [Coprinellus micaceus]|uniref:Uncharacterized protein n=1 Tax=Coprinellus micaceus TaxID=71717 RepID=A0A4Y7T0C7_COPMI|nr:hypothetical protein FA13DRAFT_1736449 [Coprinellus micaceus]